MIMAGIVDLIITIWIRQRRGHALAPLELKSPGRLPNGIPEGKEKIGLGSQGDISPTERGGRRATRVFDLGFGARIEKGEMVELE